MVTTEQPARPTTSRLRGRVDDHPDRAGEQQARCVSGVECPDQVRLGKTIRDGVLRYRRYLERSGKIGTEFVKQAATFSGRMSIIPAMGEKQSGGTFRKGINSAGHGSDEDLLTMTPIRNCRKDSQVASIRFRGTCCRTGSAKATNGVPDQLAANPESRLAFT